MKSSFLFSRLRNASTRRGYTVPEVAICCAVLIAFLTLLLPWLGRRGQPEGRRSTCANYLKQLALATATLEAGRNRYPGSVELQTITIHDASHEILMPWQVSLMPYIERQDIYDQFTTKIAKKNSTTEYIGEMYYRGAGGFNEGNSLYMKWLRCPSNPPTSVADGQSSYVCNAGGDVTNEITDGVFLDRVGSKTTKINSADIADGLSNTWAFSESLHALEWSDVSTPYTSSYAFKPDGPEIEFAKIANSFIWTYAADDLKTAVRPTDAIHGLLNPPALEVPVNPAARVNAVRKNHGTLDKYDLRPSSNHPGVFLVSYLDGHTGIIRVNIDYKVYQQLMTPDHAKSFAPHTQYKLKEADLD